jgi:hypothetical protein
MPSTFRPTTLDLRFIPDQRHDWDDDCNRHRDELAALNLRQAKPELE